MTARCCRCGANSADRVARRARLPRGLGGEHHSAAWENIADPVVFLAAAGERTQAHPPRFGRRQPALTRTRCSSPTWFAQLDYMTNGRACSAPAPAPADFRRRDDGRRPGHATAADGRVPRRDHPPVRGEVVTHIADWFEAHEEGRSCPPGRSMPIAVASTTSPSGMVAAGKHGVGVSRSAPASFGGEEGPQRRSGRWAKRRPPPTARCCAARIGASSSAAHVAETAREGHRRRARGREYERLHYSGASAT